MNGDNFSRIIRLARLRFLVAGFLLFSFGALLSIVSGADFILGRFLISYAILFLAQLSVSYSNDYFDFDADQYGKPTSISGGSGVLQTNPELRRFSKWFAILLMSSSIVVAMIFTILFFIPMLFLVLVVLGNLVGWYYAAPPLKLAYRGLGEVAGMVAIGLLMPGMGFFALKGIFDSIFLVFVLPSTFYACAFMVSVEIPDMEADTLGHKKTLIVLKGRGFGFKLIALLLFLATLSFAIFYTTNLFQSTINFGLITLLSLIPLAIGIFGLVRQSDNREVATRLASHYLSTFFVFLLMLNCYLVVMLLH